MPKLGDLLAQNIAREEQIAVDSTVAFELLRTPEEREEFLIAKRFFDEARDYFTQGIQNRLPVKELFRQVGGGARFTGSKENHPQFAGVLRGHQTIDRQRGPDSLYNPRRFAALWSEFQLWAESEGLEAWFKEGTDGGGQESWWELRIRPRKPTSRRTRKR